MRATVLYFIVRDNRYSCGTRKTKVILASLASLPIEYLFSSSSNLFLQETLTLLQLLLLAAAAISCMTKTTYGIEHVCRFCSKTFV
jgi:hypothetical protein